MFRSGHVLLQASGYQISFYVCKKLLHPTFRYFGLQTLIENIIRSESLLSEETLIANHPWISDPVEELKRLKKQRERESAGVYGRAFRRKGPPEGDDA